jgi:hypothetical protein
MSAPGGEAQRSAHGGRYTDHSLRRVIRCRALVVREYIYKNVFFHTRTIFLYCCSKHDQKLLVTTFQLECTIRIIKYLLVVPKQISLCKTEIEFLNHLEIFQDTVVCR